MGYEAITQNKLRGIDRYSIGFLISGDRLIWTNQWFKKVRVLEELFIERIEEFDDGWDYMIYWGPWTKVWKFKKIV